jgi:hypothetical protein
MSQPKNRHLFFRCLLLLAAIYFISTGYSCSEKTQVQDKIIVAKVGKSEISLEDFRLDYEFGFSHLKTGPNRKLAYLDKMIDEKLLATKGYKLNLDKSERVQRLAKELQDELAIEQVFKDNVQAKVRISDQEIVEAINKAKVSWKLRYWWEPGKEFAESVCAFMRQHGYAETVEKILSNNPEINLKPGEFETPYMTWLDVAPELLAQIENLAIGEISDPVEMDQGYYIFQVVDIRRQPVTEYEYKDKADTFRKILRARKEQELNAQFIASLMIPKNVTTKGDAFSLLSRNLFEWYKNGDRSEDLYKAIADSRNEQACLQEIRKSLDKVLVTFEKDSWTIRDFLKRFNPREIKVTDKTDLNVFQSNFNDQIALTVRDYFLLKQGHKDRVERRPVVQMEIKRWKDKWVYQELRNQLTKSIAVSEDDARAYFEEHPSRFRIGPDDHPLYEKNMELAKRYAAHDQELQLLKSETENLKKQYAVVINRAVLDTLSTIEFEKSRSASVQIFKRSTNRMAYPVVDPSWGF